MKTATRSMKKFSFRLEKLLRLKERAEQIKLQKHEEARRRVREQEAALSALERERLANNDRQRKIMSGGIDVIRLRTYSRYYHKLRGDRLAGEGLRSTLIKDQHAKHSQLVAAARERKTLERYREKSEARYLAEVERHERAELDELATQRFIHEKTSSSKRSSN